MDNYIFSFHEFIKELRENEEKKEMIEKYESFNGEIVGEAQDQIWYKEYVSKFEPIKYTVSKSSEDDFDWNLFIQLVASSFSSEAMIQLLDNGNISIRISVENKNEIISKNIVDLYGFQIYKLYCVFIEEQLAFQIHWWESETEREEVIIQRNNKLKRWNIILNHYNKLQIMQSIKNELDDLNLFD